MYESVPLPSVAAENRAKRRTKDEGEKGRITEETEDRERFRGPIPPFS